MSKPTQMRPPPPAQEPFTAFAVLPNGRLFQAARLDVDAEGKITKSFLCEPCGESLAYTYLRARLDEHWVANMIKRASTGR